MSFHLFTHLPSWMHGKAPESEQPTASAAPPSIPVVAASTTVEPQVPTAPPLLVAPVSTVPNAVPSGIRIYTIEGKNMSIAAIIALVTALLPEAEQIASIFIHNANSKHTLSVVTGEVNTIAAVAQAVASQPVAAAAPAPAAPAA